MSNMFILLVFLTIFINCEEFPFDKYTKVPIEVKTKLIDAAKDSLDHYETPYEMGSLVKNLKIKSLYLYTKHLGVYDREVEFAYSDSDDFRKMIWLGVGGSFTIKKYFDQKVENVVKIYKTEDNFDYEKDELDGKDAYFFYNSKMFTATLYQEGKFYYYSIYVQIRGVADERFLFSKSSSQKNKYMQDVKNAFLYKTHLELQKMYLESKGRVIIEGGSEKDSEKQILMDHLRDVQSTLVNAVSPYVQNRKGNIKIIFDTFNIDDYDTIVNKYNLPGEIQDQLEALMYSKDNNFREKALKFVAYDAGSSHYEEIIGIGVKYGDLIFLAYAHSKVECELKPRYLYYPCEKDETPDPDGKCRYQQVPYDDQDKYKIKRDLENFSLKECIIKLSLMETGQTLLRSDDFLVSENKLYIAKVGDDGMIYVGSYARQSTLFKTPLYTIGKRQVTSYKPYNILIASNGQLYIINKDNEKVWRSSVILKDSKGPYKLVLMNDNSLKVIDSKNQVVTDLKLYQRN